MKHYFGVDCKGCGKAKASAPILLWKDLLEVDILSFSLNHISAKYVCKYQFFQVILTGFYGFLDQDRKPLS